MVSALTGSGVKDIVNYLMDQVIFGSLFMLIQCLILHTNSNFSFITRCQILELFKCEGVIKEDVKNGHVILLSFFWKIQMMLVNLQNLLTVFSCLEIFMVSITCTLREINFLPISLYMLCKNNILVGFDV